MSIGYSIYFTPEDRQWIGTPDLIRGVADMFGVSTMESVHIYRKVDAPSGVELSWDEREEKLLELNEPSIESVILAQRTDGGCTTIMYLPDSETLTQPMGDAVINRLPENLSEGCIPIYAIIHNGRWEVYDQGGDRRDGGACCLELGNRLGYPVEMELYLEAYLKVPDVNQFQHRLEELSMQPWCALIELT